MMMIFQESNKNKKVMSAIWWHYGGKTHFLVAPAPPVQQKFNIHSWKEVPLWKPYNGFFTPRDPGGISFIDASGNK